jgi:hypothetical protein
MNVSSPHQPSLLSPENRGGVTGGEGYNFQDAFVTSRLPEWLANPMFSCLLKEGVGDVEVKFIKSDQEYADLYQIKDHIVAPAEFREVVATFFKKDRQLPGVYSKFILACRGLSKAAESVRQVVEELRGAYSMYKSGGSILRNTEKDVEARTKTIDLNVPINFLRKKVFFDTEIGDMKTDNRLCDQFIGSVVRNIPKWANADPLSLTAAYRDISYLINRAIRRTLSREELEKAIQQTINLSPPRISEEGVRVRLFHWEDPAFDLSEKWDLLLDWSAHFDRATRKVPDSSVWQDRLIPDLEQAQRRIRSSTNSKLIRFRPSACLSAGIALGWSFSEVKGYTFEIQQGPDIWRSDLPMSTESHLVIAREISLDESSEDLCVEINQQADVTLKVDRYMRANGKTFRGKITLIPDLGIGAQIDCSIALAYATEAKKLIRQAVDKYRCKTVHLFYAGPLGLAILMGRLFNAMHADIQCYEEQDTVGYVPSCLLR